MILIYDVYFDFDFGFTSDRRSNVGSLLYIHKNTPSCTVVLLNSYPEKSYFGFYGKVGDGRSEPTLLWNRIRVNKNRINTRGCIIIRLWSPSRNSFYQYQKTWVPRMSDLHSCLSIRYPRDNRFAIWCWISFSGRLTRLEVPNREWVPDRVSGLLIYPVVEWDSLHPYLRGKVSWGRSRRLLFVVICDQYLLNWGCKVTGGGNVK